MKTFTEEISQELKSKTDILIPLYEDHKDRIFNLKFVIQNLKSYGFDNIHVREIHSNDKSGNTFIAGGVKKYSREIVDSDNFNKMKCINDMISECGGDCIAIWDVDVFFPRSNIENAMRLLYEGSDVVYPYDGEFYNIPKDEFCNLDSGNVDLSKCELCNENSYGGSVFFNKKSFIEGGMCNPNFKNVGFDDNEIFVRFHKLGYDIQRTSGPLLHLDHFRSETSVEKSEFLNDNMAEYNRICGMNKEQLEEEIKTWR